MGSSKAVYCSGTSCGRYRPWLFYRLQFPGIHSVYPTEEAPWGRGKLRFLCSYKRRTLQSWEELRVVPVARCGHVTPVLPSLYHSSSATLSTRLRPKLDPWLHTISRPLMRMLSCAAQMGKNCVSIVSSSASLPRSSKGCSACLSPQNLLLPRSPLSTSPSPPTSLYHSSSTSILAPRPRYPT